MTSNFPLLLVFIVESLLHFVPVLVAEVVVNTVVAINSTLYDVFTDDVPLSSILYPVYDNLIQSLTTQKSVTTPIRSCAVHNPPYFKSVRFLIHVSKETCGGDYYRVFA